MTTATTLSSLAQAEEGTRESTISQTGRHLARGVDLQAYLDQLEPLTPLLRDPSVTEVMVNGPEQVFCERSGRLALTDIKFKDDADVIRVIDIIARFVGRRADASAPLLDARLADGSRVNAVIPPLALDGPSITIRKFAADPITVQQLIAWGSISPEAAAFLQACVLAKANIIISGGTGSGKTTLLNVLSGFIPHDERIVTIEDAAELQLKQEHVVRLESRPAALDGQGRVTVRDLVINSLRMRPDRIVVGECRSGEALDMLQAMNTGHDGSLTTIHANTPRDALGRLETLVLMAGMDLPLRVIREQIASALHLIVQTSRLRDGSRKVTAITELAGREGETITSQEIFVFEQTGLSEHGDIVGKLKYTGIRPKIIEKVYDRGLPVSPELQKLFPGGRGSAGGHSSR
jgi:pilus assembly protein CpaF